MTIESTIQRAGKEIAEGRLWRAKEILSSSVSTYGFSREIFVAYANLLLRMGDDFDAGRYYLLSVDEPDESQKRVMSLFMQRYRNDGWQQLHSRFPHAARIENRDSYPTFLSAHLRSLNAPEILTKKQEIARSVSGLNTWLLTFGCLAAALSIAICTLVGAYTILSWIAGLRQ